MVEFPSLRDGAELAWSRSNRNGQPSGEGTNRQSIVATPESAVEVRAFPPFAR